MKLQKVLTFLIDRVFLAVCFFMMLYSIYYVFNIAPDERVMGAVQRILYFHVGAATSTYLALGLLFIASVTFLVDESDQISKYVDLPALGKASSLVGFLFASIVLITGMIWGYSSWNTWWHWEPRLVSMLVLWIFLLSYLYLSVSEFKSLKQRDVVTAVVGILCSIQVPIVIYSIKLLDRTQQHHPEVVGKMGLKDPRYTMALVLSMLTLLLLTSILVRLSYRIIKVKKLISLKKEEKLYL